MRRVDDKARSPDEIHVGNMAVHGADNWFVDEPKALAGLEARGGSQHMTVTTKTSWGTGISGTRLLGRRDADPFLAVAVFAPSPRRGFAPDVPLAPFGPRHSGDESRAGVRWTEEAVECSSSHYTTPVYPKERANRKVELVGRVGAGHRQTKGFLLGKILAGGASTWDAGFRVLGWEEVAREAALIGLTICPGRFCHKASLY